MTKEMIDTLNSHFHLSEAQWKKYYDWVETLPEKYYGAVSDGISIIFEHHSIGIVVTAKRDEGEEIDLTDWNNFG